MGGDGKAGTAGTNANEEGTAMRCSSLSPAAIQDLVEEELASLPSSQKGGHLQGIPADRFCCEGWSDLIITFCDGLVVDLSAVTPKDEEEIIRLTAPTDFYRQGKRMIFVYRVKPAGAEHRAVRKAVECKRKGK
jgi:hypothetical protein